MTKNLTDAKWGEEYIIKDVLTEDPEVKNFLLTLGCYSGEKIVLVSVLNSTYAISIRNVKYGIDKELATLIAI